MPLRFCLGLAVACRDARGRWLRCRLPEFQSGARATFRLQQVHAVAVAGECFGASVWQRLGEQLLLG